MFQKFSKEIIVLCNIRRTGSDSNPSLKLAIAKAKAKVCLKQTLKRQLQK
ncbi:hypothetical protein [Metamycoplasma hominis]|nr:hypothetical protein [Metamycoplasma hominis]